MTTRRRVKGDCSRLKCPHCGSVCAIRDSGQVTLLTRESIYACSNPECGHTFVGITEIVRTLSPSATPNPAVDLPLSRHIRRDVLRNQIDHARPADHGPLFSMASGPPS